MNKAAITFLFFCLALSNYGQRISGSVDALNLSIDSERTLAALPPGLIFYEGFDNTKAKSLPSDWTTYSSGDDGFYAGTSGASSGQANQNGFWPVPKHGFFAMTNDDVCNCDKSFDLLTSKEFNFSDIDYVRLGFSAFQNGSGGQIASIQIKTSDKPWTTIFTIPSSAVWEEYDVLIPSNFLASGFHFRIRYSDQGNYASGLAIDDIYMSNDVSYKFSLEAFYTQEGSKDATGHLPEMIPETQARNAHLQFGAFALNEAASKKNARLAVDIDGPLSFSDTTSNWLLTANSSQTVTFPDRNTFTPFELGSYSIAAELITDSMDQVSSDNVFSTEFNVNDSIYRHTSAASDGTGIWMLDTFDRAGSVFSVYSPQAVVAARIQIHPTTEIGARFRVKIFNYEALSNSIFSTSPINITSDDLGTEKRVELGFNLNPGRYVFVVELEAKRLVISTTAKDKSPDGISFYKRADSQWENLSYYPFMSLIFPPVDEACPGHIQATLNDESCPGSDDGSIAIELKGATTVANYTWSNGAGNVDMISNLAPGTYQVLALDDQACSYSRTFEIAASDTIEIDPIIGLDTCSLAIGSIQFNATGSHEPFSYKWDEKTEGNSLIGIEQGTYSLQITSETGCSLDTSIFIGGSNPLNVALAVQNSGCGSSNGIISATALGSAPFTYQWSTADTTSAIDSLQSGLYRITVTDSIGCVSEVTAIVNDSNSALLSINNLSHNLCFGQSNGAISLNISGNGPFTYAWSNDASDSSITGLQAGIYTITATDNSGCKSFGVYEVQDQSNAFDVDLLDLGIDCQGDETGEIKALVYGGKLPYNYVWDGTSGSSNEVTDLTEGTFSVTVTDANNCEAISSTTIISRPPFFYVLDSIRGDSNGVSSLDAGIYLTPFGGTAPYNFDWSNGSENQNLVGVDTGWYSVTITDQLGCELFFEKYLSDNQIGTKNIVIERHTTLFPNPASTDKSIQIQSNFEINKIEIFDIQGRSVSFKQSSLSIDQIQLSEPGTYMVLVLDSQGFTSVHRLIIL